MKCTRLMFFLTGMLAVLGSGCVSTVQFVPLPDQTLTTATEGKARIYLLRQMGMQGAVYPSHVRDGDVEIGEIGQGRYLCWERKPGVATIHLRWWTPSIANPEVTIKADCRAGYTYFIGHFFIFTGPASMQNELTFLQQDEAHEFLENVSPPTAKMETR